MAKMTKADFALLSLAIKGVMNDPLTKAQANPENYKKHNLTLNRFRWDIFHRCGSIVSRLYKLELNDDHIETALKKIIPKWPEY